MPVMRNQLTLNAQLKIVLFLALLISIIEIVNLLLGRQLNTFGLIPRNTDALIGIITAPFLHGSLLHYTSNIFPLCIFSFLMLQHGLVRFIFVSCFCVLVSGLLVWCFGRSAIHVGASGLIYGYLGYLLLAGWLSGKLKLLLISLFVGVTYGGLVFGILPSNPYISWESHLFGFISGIVCAFFTRNN